MNFLSVKTPLEREKCRCLLLVILVEARRRVGGACPAQRYPLIQGDGRSRTVRSYPLSRPSSRSIYNVPFVRPLSKKSITRQHARVPSPCELPPEREAEFAVALQGKEREGSRWCGDEEEGGTPLGRRTYLFYTGRSLRPGMGWNPLSS